MSFKKEKWHIIKDINITLKIIKQITAFSNKFTNWYQTIPILIDNCYLM